MKKVNIPGPTLDEIREQRSKLRSNEQYYCYKDELPIHTRKPRQRPQGIAMSDVDKATQPHSSGEMSSGTEKVYTQTWIAWDKKVQERHNRGLARDVVGSKLRKMGITQTSLRGVDIPTSTDFSLPPVKSKK